MGIERTIDITPVQQQIILKLLDRHLPDTTAWVYGSRAKWTSRPQSDLDLVVFAKPKQELQVSLLREEFEESDLPFRVDLFVWDQVPESFRTEIERDHVVLVESQSRFATSQWRTMKFCDAFLINPPVSLERGQHYPFVDMASVMPGARSVAASKQKPFSGSGSRFMHGDTLMARITPCLENGKIGRYQATNETREAHGSTEFIVIRGSQDVSDSTFAYYATRSDTIRNYSIGQMTGTSGRQRVPVEALANLPIKIPPLPEQRAIAHILGTLDDKIELNRRMNETLEAMARAIFNDWFVTFGPTRAKMEGRPPYLPPEIWNLFPDKLVDSDIGEIPRGYSSSLAGNLFECWDKKRVPLSGNDRAKRQGPFPYYGATGIVDYVNDFIFDGTYLLIGEDGSVEKDDGTAFSQYVSGKIWVNNHAHVLTGKNRVSTEFLFLAFQHIKISPYVTGAVQLKISQKNLRKIPVVSPPRPITNAFQKLVGPVFQRRLQIERSNKELSELRDILLPKLISGEIRTSDAEKPLEEAGI